MNARESGANDCKVGCYYFPGYHADPRNDVVHGRGWTEWSLVKAATPRFRGHRQPLVPQWGYEDEASVRAMERKIAAAADHGIDCFIFDWYWYEGPFLQRPLDEAFMKARNNRRIKFCLMWANHDWIDLHPAKARTAGPVRFPGVFTLDAWRAVNDWVIEKYFQHPSYFTIAGAPYFSFYDLQALLQSFGGIKKTRKALDAFRLQAQAAGFPDLHLNAVVWGRTILPGETVPADPEQLVEALGFDSVTSYVWIHHVALPAFPGNPYAAVRDGYFKYWDWADANFRVPYFPNVTMGWDSTPRTVQTDVWEAGQPYPHGHMIQGNTPAAFRQALRMTRQRLQHGPEPCFVTINAWNEWTEGSYLEPDTRHGMRYLEAIRDVFGETSGKYRKS
jgi:hypothetical protein